MAIDWGNVDKAAAIWQPMAGHLIASKAAAKATAMDTAKWQAEQQIGAYKVGVEQLGSRLESMENAITSGEFEQDNPGNRKMYADLFTATRNAYIDYVRATGGDVVEPAETDIIKLVNAVFDTTEKQHPKANHADLLKWGNEGGAYGKFIKRIDESVDPMVAFHVWNGLWKERYPEGGKDFDAGEGEIKKLSPAGIVSGSLGGFSDVAVGMWKRAGEALSSFWRLENRFSPMTKEDWNEGRIERWLDKVLNVKSREGPIRSVLQQVLQDGEKPKDGEKPIITPEGEPLSLGPSSGLDRMMGTTGMINFDFSDEEVVSPERLEKSVASLEGMEERAVEREQVERQQPKEPMSTLTTDAQVFLAKLLDYLTAYGEDEAQILLSAEFQELSPSSKQEIVEYLKESEAFA